VWEVDLAADAKRTTWIRANAWDNRRMPLAPSFDATVTPPAPAAPMTSSPDIVVRPKWPRTVVPSFIGGPIIAKGLANAYQLWTFQTALRWLYPSVAATRKWTEALGNLVILHRTTMALPALPQIDAALWSNVVGGVRVKNNGIVSTDLADPLAVYRAPWHTGIGRRRQATHSRRHPSLISGTKGSCLTEELSATGRSHHPGLHPPGR